MAPIAQPGVAPIVCPPLCRYTDSYVKREVPYIQPLINVTDNTLSMCLELITEKSIKPLLFRRHRMPYGRMVIIKCFLFGKVVIIKLFVLTIPYYL